MRPIQFLTHGSPLNQFNKNFNYLLVKDPQLLALLLAAASAVGVPVHVAYRLGDRLRPELVHQLLHQRLGGQPLLVQLRPERVLRQLRRRNLKRVHVSESENSWKICTSKYKHHLLSELLWVWDLLSEF